MSFQIYFIDMRHGRLGKTVCVANSEEEFRNTTVEELKRKLIPEHQLADTILRYRFNTLKKNRTLGFYGIKHEDYITAVRRGSSYTGPTLIARPRPSPVQVRSSKWHWSIVAPEDDYEDEDEDKVIPRSQSMDKLLFDMNQPQLKPSE
ncbi:uncharacterized protein LOC143738893 [Siphateles boraxobius]|uniref:uncharacterized protein LOC143738893 n=1 Tax=Siphateles boraxobius TaxID=180520 RepID=UPI0040639344